MNEAPLDWKAERRSGARGNASDSDAALPDPGSRGSRLWALVAALRARARQIANSDATPPAVFALTVALAWVSHLGSSDLGAERAQARWSSGRTTIGLIGLNPAGLTFRRVPEGGTEERALYRALVHSGYPAATDALVVWSLNNPSDNTYERSDCLAVQRDPRPVILCSIDRKLGHQPLDSARWRIRAEGAKAIGAFETWVAQSAVSSGSRTVQTARSPRKDPRAIDF